MSGPGQIRSSEDVRRTTALAPKAEVHPQSRYVAEVPILLRKSLMVLANSDSVALIRFAAEWGDDGTA
jgi:hypothetical protein